ncbi:aminoglycoside 3'-phosphotransferase [Lactobacillus paragasseri]|uniref:aminoglycoside 3'-phosphotransferase n=1 Tax=Lactobacillus paragasseri TaxID=2107999 RepID=UPI00217D4D79|nr:aminoglycoside 3'-phosphotransferase [Lactobacillus paragasseri]UWI44067.1 aminoglycoside 3'-phosphotransferase [Lactobacillus paragasseri]UWI45310.1 aminoglycoside 3'-phosphotransferase [Lactobacillus paragasseri]
MKKTLITHIPEELPKELQYLIAGADIYDSSSSLEARVYFIDKDGGYYLKCAKTGTLEKEAKMTQYFHSKKLGAEVLNYTSNDHDWLLTKAVVGHDCIDSEYLNYPKRLCDTIATELRKLHEIDYSDCPVMDRTAEYLAKAENNYRTGNYDKSSFPNSFGYRSAEQAHEVLTTGKDVLKSKVLLHGDYCLPNIILNNWKFSGFIDLDCAGVGDRHIDLFWGTWTLWFNLKTNQYYDRFLDAYGRDKVDEELLKVVAAAEVFG